MIMDVSLITLDLSWFSQTLETSLLFMASVWVISKIIQLIKKA